MAEAVGSHQTDRNQELDGPHQRAVRDRIISLGARLPAAGLIAEASKSTEAVQRFSRPSVKALTRGIIDLQRRRPELAPPDLNEHLRELDSRALVGAFSHIGRTAHGQQETARRVTAAVEALHDNGVIKPNMVVGLGGFMPETFDETELSEFYSGMVMLQKKMASKYRVRAVLRKDPIALPAVGTADIPKVARHAFATAAYEFKTEEMDYLRRQEDIPPDQQLGYLGYVSPGYHADEALANHPLVHGWELKDGGIVTMENVGDREADDHWLAHYRHEYASFA